MTIASWAYGSVEGVAQLRPHAASALKTFDANTNPSLTTVESWINSVSSMINAALAERGFAIPVSAELVKPQLDLFVNTEVAEILDSVTGGGRVGGRLEERRNFSTMVSIIRSDVTKFIEDFTIGLEALGASRSYSAMTGVGTKSLDDNGDEVEPLIKREYFEPFWRGLDD